MQASTLKLAGASLALAALVAGCSDSATNTTDVQTTPRLSALAAPGELRVCKYTVKQDDVNVPTADNLDWGTTTSGSFTATKVSGGGSLASAFSGGASVTLTFPDDNNCATVWTGAEDAVIEVTETPATGSGLAFYRVWSTTDGGSIQNFQVAGIKTTPTTVQVTMSGSVGREIWFKNMPYTPPPPGGNEGCTPGYWKQSQHFDSWTLPYTPSTTFASVFGAGYFPSSLTLLQALGLNGGGINALARHSVAALLNAANGTVDYPDESTASIVTDFQNAVAGGASTIEAQKNEFDSWNNGAGGCPLN